MDKVQLVERALWEGVQATPDNNVELRADWVQTTTPRAPTPFLNGVHRCEISDVAEAQQKVQQTVAHYASLNLPFRWKVAPSSQPQNLPELLNQAGLSHRETLYGLFAEPHALKIVPRADVVIRELSAETLEDWLRVQANAWSVPPQGIAYIRRTQTEALAKNEKTYQNFVAYLNGEPVASAALRIFPDYGFLMGAAVNAEARGQGVYKALLAHRLKIIGDQQLPTVIHCLQNTSAPICLKLGFEKVCEIRSFEI